LRYGHEDGIVGIGGVTTSAGRDGSDGTKTVCRRGWVDVGKRLAVEDSTVLACRAHADELLLSERRVGTAFPPNR
jgi:hypothetical protein